VNRKTLSGRAIKRKIYDLLKSTDFDRAFQELSKLPAQQVINPLFASLHSTEQDAKWAAVKAMGAVVAKLADADMESARVIMRRLMWNLNDESGGIGWGSPEAMGEILANHEGLAKEYAHILISYTRENGNYLEHEVLQRGLLWGIGRLAQVRPHHLQNAVQHLMAYLESRDATVRGLAAWVMGLVGAEEASSRLQRLKNDKSQIQTYMEHGLITCRVMDLAEQALNAIISRGEEL
jgi:HEAT repeat protein